MLAWIWCQVFGLRLMKPIVGGERWASIARTQALANADEGEDF